MEFWRHFGGEAFALSNPVNESALSGKGPKKITIRQRVAPQQRPEASSRIPKRYHSRPMFLSRSPVYHEPTNTNKRAAHRARTDANQLRTLCKQKQTT